MSRALFLSALLMAIPFLTGCADLFEPPVVTEIRAALPPGSSIEKVDHYLTQHQIEHSYFRTSNQVMAVTKNVQNNSLVQPDISVTFTFDDYHRLTDVNFKPAYLSP